MLAGLSRPSAHRNVSRPSPSNSGNPSRRNPPPPQPPSPKAVGSPPSSGHPHLTPLRNAPGTFATSAGPAPPAPHGAGSGRSCGTSSAAPGCSRRCPRWASAPEERPGGSGRLRAENRTSGWPRPGSRPIVFKSIKYFLTFIGCSTPNTIQMFFS